MSFCHFSHSHTPRKPSSDIMSTINIQSMRMWEIVFGFFTLRVMFDHQLQFFMDCSTLNFNFWRWKLIVSEICGNVWIVWGRKTNGRNFLVILRKTLHFTDQNSLQNHFKAQISLPGHQFFIPKPLLHLIDIQMKFPAIDFQIAWRKFPILITSSLFQWIPRS